MNWFDLAHMSSGNGGRKSKVDLPYQKFLFQIFKLFNNVIYQD